MQFRYFRYFLVKIISRKGAKTQRKSQGLMKETLAAGESDRGKDIMSL